jgi:hypothetical protein
MIIGTSFAPSPIERVIFLSKRLARPTTSDFCFGDTRQQITEAALHPKLKNFRYDASVEKTNDRVGPSITSESLDLVGGAAMAAFSFESNSSWLLEVRMMSSIVSRLIKLQLLPISIAVSYLSPVSTQRRMSA